MSDQLISTTNTAAILPEVWSARFRDVLRVALPWMTSVDQNYEGDIQSLGDTVNISQIPDFDDATELAEGALGEADSVTVTGQQLVINKRTYKDVLVTKKSQLQSLAFMDQIREKQIFAINKRVQQVIIDNIIPSASAPDHQIAYDSGTTFALADLLEGKELLDTANVPMDNRTATFGAAQWNDIFNITGFTSRDFLDAMFVPAGSPLNTGEVPNVLLGFTPKMTTANGAVVYLSHASFLTVAMQQSLQIGVFDQRVIGLRGDRVTADILWGLKQLDDNRVVTIS